MARFFEAVDFDQPFPLFNPDRISKTDTGTSLPMVEGAVIVRSKVMPPFLYRLKPFPI